MWQLVQGGRTADCFRMVWNNCIYRRGSRSNYCACFSTRHRVSMLPYSAFHCLTCLSSDKTFRARRLSNDDAGCRSVTCKCTDNGCNEACVCVSQNVVCGDGCNGCKDGCDNCPFSRLPAARLETVHKGRKGVGVRAVEDIPAHGFVVEIVGTVLRSKTFHYHNRANQKDPFNRDYVLQLEKDYYIEFFRTGNISRFINHSCAPNCRLSIR